MKCKHKWVAMEDGSLRKFCVRCAKFAMQAQATYVPRMPDISVSINNFKEIIKTEPVNIEAIAMKIQSEVMRNNMAMRSDLP